MQIHIGYEIVYECAQAVPMILTLHVHSSRACDLVTPDCLVTEPAVPITAYHDSYGNWCSRLVAPPGEFKLSAHGLVNDGGQPDAVVPGTRQHPIHELPPETLLYLLGSRYCETDLLSDTAWQLFGSSPEGWGRVQAICDYVNQHIVFDYQHACATKTAREVFNERLGVCRDYVHLALAFCRCMNIPARYCTGYLSDIGAPPPYGVMDFAAWMEVYLGGQWHMFDARNNKPHIGRILMARGRDAADVALSTSFGPSMLKSFTVWADEVV